jgi:small-conductance mechanosensitive channel
MMWLLSLVTGLGVPLRWAKPVLGLVAAIALIGAFFGLKSCYDHSIIKTHDAKQEAATAKADRAADTKAAEQRRADDARLSTETQQIKEAVNEAGSDPAARRAAYYRCVQLQQQARHSGKPPADC